ncbi:MAG: MarR family transcriptional regulator [Chthoniobacteraceae bacterium]
MAHTREASRLRADAERLADIFTVLQRCFLLRLSKDLAKGNVSFPQYLLLGFLVQRERLTMSEIAQKMGHTTAASTGLVDRLENLGLVRRDHDRDDRRKIFVQPTPAGRALVISVRDDMVDNLLTLMAALEPDEQKAWVRIYEKIVRFFDTP